MHLFEQFKQHWSAQFSGVQGQHLRLLLAVSGGVDSVVLADLVHRTGIPFVIAHANFGLRDEESMRDENFVRGLGADYGAEVLVKHFETDAFAKEKHLSIQEAARELRYHWFREILAGWTNNTSSSTAFSKNYIATAHHADDNIETILMHFFRGTGIEGLTGMLPLRAEFNLIRPLLPFRKAALLEYAKERGLGFVEDSSNQSDKYTRNFFRNTLLPQLTQVFPSVEENLLDNIERFTETAAIFHRAIQKQLDKLRVIKGDEIHVAVGRWKHLEAIRTITWELIKPYGFTAAQVPELIKLLDAGSGSYVASASHRVIKNRNWMIISPLAVETADHWVIEKDTAQIDFAAGILQMEELTSIPEINAAATEAWLNAKDIRFPLVLRKWRQGDYFYPLGMSKKKKVSRFLIDQKLSLPAKEKTWVIESGKKIIWLVGLRIDHRFRVTDDTKSVLHLTYRK